MKTVTLTGDINCYAERFADAYRELSLRGAIVHQPALSRIPTDARQHLLKNQLVHLDVLHTRLIMQSDAVLVVDTPEGELLLDETTARDVLLAGGLNKPVLFHSSYFNPYAGTYWDKLARDLEAENTNHTAIWIANKSLCLL